LAPPFFEYTFVPERILISNMERGSDILRAAKILRDGGLVAFPTETVYGLGANGFDPIAVTRIFEVKQRPSFDPLILHVGWPEQAEELFRYPEANGIKELIRNFWPGPLTIVAEKKSCVPDIVTSGLPTVAVRMPSNSIALSLIREAGVPVAAPSANLFGRLSPTLAHHVQKQLQGVDYLLDGGKTQIGLESTIVSLSDNKVRLLRPGLITIDQIREFIPSAESGPDPDDGRVSAPGQLKSHYSPEKPLHIFEKLTDFPGKATGIILMEPHDEIEKFGLPTIVLSKLGDLREAAANMFTALHEMENDERVTEIYIQQAAEYGIGIAIMDRLRKAAFRHQ
jgi:L-threonylcarbamoyladenylate synthase